MLSSRAKYALRACVFLAENQQEQEEWVLSPDIAEAEDIPRKFLEAILVELRDHGIVESRRGRYGGYRLARPADRIASSEVIRIVDGPLALAPCASKTHFGPCSDCLDVRLCALQPMLRKARDSMAGVLEGYMLSQLVRDRRARLLRNARARLQKLQTETF
ncbi:MAG: Rrf2 family transcriptional regulator [Acetobacteraceae bacterium]|nr:Rrf2 family transcriptional regulator [Acetobacteraceae bacterium]